MILSVAQINELHTLLQEYDSATHVSIQTDYGNYAEVLTKTAYFFKYTKDQAPLLLDSIEITE
jgi:hypothetical protein